MGLFAGKLLPASFRGVPFAVTRDEIGGGRRVALHQYPGKDEPWAEDMGREARRWRFSGFIVDGDVVFFGGPIQLQRALLIAALEKSGPGTLTVPTLGIVQAAVTRFSVGQDLGAGRVSSLEIEFVEAGKRSFPSLLSNGSGLLSAANLCKLALVVDGVRLVALAAGAGGRRQDLANTAAAYSSKALELGADATALYRLTAQLPGAYGRYAAGGNAGISGENGSTYSADTTIGDLIAVSSGARVRISAAARALSDAAAIAVLGYAQGVADAIVALVQALADACADPDDSIRLLEQLLGFQSTRPEASTAIGAAIGAMVRRAAAASLVVASGQYQPSSADDAAAMIARIGGALAAEETKAADAGDDASYTALRDARGEVIRDLRTRGATLAQITTWRTGRALPAAVLAQRFYRDPERAEQLVAQTDVPCPLFMPTEFRALAA